jgi:hypothetical protein
MPSPNRPIPRRLDALIADTAFPGTAMRDACAFAAILLACGFAFYLHWNAWEDQSAQIYMTWGLFHGMRPYIDLIDPNWPGILLPHILAYLLSGVDAWGLRAVDLLFLLALLTATSRILISWNTPRSLRLLTGCAYLLNYFGTGWWWTAQRESFAWPLFVISSIPFLTLLGPARDTQAPVPRATAWFLFGALAGLSLWIKPVAYLAIFFLLVITPVLGDQRQRRATILGSCCFVAGIALVSLLFLGGLAATGTLAGFMKWGIRYDLGPYSQVKWPWPTRFWLTGVYLVTPEFMPLPLLLLLGGGAMAGISHLSPDRWRRHRRPLIAAAIVLFAGLMTALMQGKEHSLYHFIPMIWAIAFCAAAIWSVIPWKKPFADAAALLTAAAVIGMFIHGPDTAGPTKGEVAAARLQSTLSPQDQIVEWGYAPSLLAALQRRTPFPTFIATSFLTTSPPDSWAYREVLDRLGIALQNPSVRYLFVDQIHCFVITTALRYPRDYLLQDPAIRATLAREYRALPFGSFDGFDVLEHISRPASEKHSPMPVSP